MQNCQLPVNWRIVKVEDIKAPQKGSIVSGPFGSNISKKFFVEEGIPVIRGNNLTLGTKRFVEGGFVYITEEKAYELRNCEAITSDLIFTAAGTLGQVGLIPKNAKYPRYIISNKQLRLRCDTTIALPEYLYYWFSSPQMREYIINQNTGASVPLITLGILRSLSVNLPPLPTQRKIAAILSAYDDLIENDTRLIQILEEMAQSIYKEWFINFRFPGHEKVKMVESELGLIPEGWEVKAISELCEFISRGVTPKYSLGSSRYVINQKANRGSYMSISELKELDPNLWVPKEKLAHYGDLLVNSLGEGTLGRVHYFTGPHKTWAVDQHMTICRSSSPSITSYLYMVLSSQEGQSRIQSLKTGGTNMTMLNISALRQFKVIYPGSSLLILYYELINPIQSLKSTLENKNINLRQTRDLLLPKLISGDIDVEELDIIVDAENKR